MAESGVEGRRKTGEAGKDEVQEMQQFSLLRGVCLVSVESSVGGPCSLPHLPTPPPAHPHSFHWDLGAFPYVECLLFLDLQKRWLTTPLGHVNRESSFLTPIPPTFWGTSFSLLGEHPTEGLDVTQQKM